MRCEINFWWRIFRFGLPPIAFQAFHALWWGACPGGASVRHNVAPTSPGLVLGIGKSSDSRDQIFQQVALRVDLRG